jgi:hypothetical protein
VRIFPLSRAHRVRGGVVSVAIVTASAAASAQQSTPGPGAEALSHAHAAWDKHDVAGADALLKEAIADGGLAPDEIVDAYVYLGVVESALGRDNPSLKAFREAALIDGKFKVPDGASARVKYIAEYARKEKSKFGSFALTADAPQLVKPGAAFTTTATIDAAHITMAASLTITVHDALAQKTYTHDETPAPEVKLEVPARMTLPGASLEVRVDALDAHKNRLASVSKKVHVEAAPVPLVATNTASEPSSEETPSKEKESKGGGFWSSPWPYLIGGVALAAGGAAVFFTTRQTSDVTVDPARVTVH